MGFTKDTADKNYLFFQDFIKERYISATIERFKAKQNQIKYEYFNFKPKNQNPDQDSKSKEEENGIK